MFLNDQSVLPVVGPFDIMTYLVITHSAYTSQQIKAYKSLEAYQYYKAGFVHNVKHVQINNHFVILAKVKHSQRINAPDLLPWVILTSDGSVKTAHCTCMVGLGEACSHIAAVLFYIHCQVQDSLSCTSQLCKWEVPKYSKKVEFKQVRDMHWSKKCVSYDDCKRKDVTPLEGSELQSFLDKIYETSPNAPIFQITEPYVTISEEHQANVADATAINRFSTQLWYDHQSGRITDHLFKSVCEDSVDNPSLTLIKRICYPLKMEIKAISKKHELSIKESAGNAYYNHAVNYHKNLSANFAGLIIN
uniref:SWIM-type domain-containing protein n=1 Tax=Trichogramma kaykai TaxID=54128 RepID=A0ABD2XA14_9HYME